MFIDNLQRHQFDSHYDPTRGYRVTLNAVTDGGYYICHANADVQSEHDIHYHVDVDCELNKCPVMPIIKKVSHTTTDVLSNSINQITTHKSDYFNRTISKNSLDYYTGDGQSSFRKKHIPLETSTASVQSSNQFSTSSTYDVTQSNEHIKQLDVELSTITESITTILPMNVDQASALTTTKSSKQWFDHPKKSYHPEKRQG